MLSYLQGLRPAGKAALAFGSYGWGPGGPETIHETLPALGRQAFAGPLRAKYRPTPDILAACLARRRTSRRVGREGSRAKFKRAGLPAVTVRDRQ